MLSALINFAKFREMQLGTINQYTLEQDDVRAELSVAENELQVRMRGDAFHTTRTVAILLLTVAGAKQNAGMFCYRFHTAPRTIVLLSLCCTLDAQRGRS